MVLGGIGRISIVAAGLLAILLGFVVFLYATDHGVEATVTETRCHLSGPSVDVKTKMFGITHSADVPLDVCYRLDEGNFVIYHVRSQHTIVYEREGGNCLYDTRQGTC